MRTSPRLYALTWKKLSHICSTDTLTAYHKGKVDKSVDLHVKENDKDDGATWDSQSQKDYKVRQRKLDIAGN